MTFNPQKPRYTLKFSDKEYELEGSFGLIEAVEYAMNADIISVAQSALEIPVWKVAKLTATILKHCGNKITASDISETIMNEMGIASDEFALLRFNLFAFLKICICKPSDREQMAKDMGELIGKIEAPLPSLGNTISSSV